MEVQPEQREAQSLAFSPDGKLLATCKDRGQIQVWDVATGKIKHSLGKGEWSTLALAFTQDGKHLCSGGIGNGIQLWDMASGNEVGRVEEVHDGLVTVLVVSPDGKFLVSGGGDGTLLVWAVSALVKVGKK